MKRILLYGLVVLSACAKRMDVVINPAPGTTSSQVGSNSSVSLINLYALWPADVAVNGRQLTLFSASAYSAAGPTPWFPSGKLVYGQVFTIPDSLFDAQGNAVVGLYTTLPIRNFQLDSVVTDTILRMRNNPDSPKLVIRYPRFVLPAKGPGAYPTYATDELVLPRAAQGPRQPDHFKIRIVNMSGEPTASRYDALTLTYADGTPVSAGTSGVRQGNASDYVELPYGSLQLKVMDASGQPIEEFPGPYVDENGYPEGLSGLSYNNIRTFMPGGVYTLLVSWRSYLHGYGASGYLDWPGIVLLKENTTVASPNYIRMQAANALPGGGKVHFAVDGQDLGSLIDFGSHSDYGIFSIGPHKVVLTDGSNKELASTVFNTYSLDNITLWAYSDQGTIKILTSNNDFSNTGELPQLSIGFKPNIPVSRGFGWQCRFLNLSADVPYATFLDQTGTFQYGASWNPNPNWLQSYRNVAAGYVSSVNSYIGMGFYAPDSYDGPPFGVGMGATISAYQPASATDTATGVALGVSLDHPLIANPGLYSGGPSPGGEPGVYTIALMGRKSSSDPSDRLRLIVIKHNK